MESKMAGRAERRLGLITGDHVAGHSIQYLGSSVCRGNLYVTMTNDLPRIVISEAQQNAISSC
jgi:hypothetical protein